MEQLGIDPKLLIAQGINFALFFFLVKKFLSAPFKEFLKREQKNQEEKDRSMQELQTQGERMKKQEEDIVSRARKEADALLAQVKKDAVRIKEELIADAQKEAAQELEKVKKAMNEEKNQMEREAQEKIVQLAFMVVEKSLKDFLSESDRKKLTQAILKNSKVSGNLYEN